jgi:hypothetical protein
VSLDVRNEIVRNFEDNEREEKIVESIIELFLRNARSAARFLRGTRDLIRLRVLRLLRGTIRVMQNQRGSP